MISKKDIRFLNKTIGRILIAARDVYEIVREIPAKNLETSRVPGEKALAAILELGWALGDGNEDNEDKEE